MSAIQERPKSACEIPSKSRPFTYAGVDDERRSRLPEHLRSTYTSHLRSSSQTSWDGLDLGYSRANQRPRSTSPRRTRRPERPRSIACIPDSYLLNVDRWSYDRVRMPATSSSTQLPEFESRPSLPSSSQTTRRSPSPSISSVSSRPTSAHFVNAFGGPNDPILPLPSTPYATGTGASTPTLSVTHPDGSTEPFPLILPSPVHTQQQQPCVRRAAETEPSSSVKHHTQMAASPYDEPLTSQAEKVGGSKADGGIGRQRGMSVDSIMNTPGCCGLCERGTAKMIGGKITAWVVGTMIPVTFGVMTGVLSKMFH
ncbi:hypothetical protein QBC40DRAFT_286732 [Triangularia verruculosa]|uniref:Uncharacterized protein n=1 Tax=Triangularia verruculosa TaxID=2587418 RepID=A0AAN6X9U4_9PEZI|nr:hypothetical protein QBC40DRAFT_286732 [Triangularia verruculosa]